MIVRCSVAALDHNGTMYLWLCFGCIIIHANQFDDWVQNCSNSIALAMELLQSGTKPSSYLLHCFTHTAPSNVCICFFFSPMSAFLLSLYGLSVCCVIHVISMAFVQALISVYAIHDTPSAALEIISHWMGSHYLQFLHTYTTVFCCCFFMCNSIF